MNNKQKTIEALNGAFQNSETGKINEAYLNDILQIDIANTRRLYDLSRTNRSSAESVVWQALIYEANVRLEWEFEKKQYTASSEHLKYWLETYGRGYGTIAKTVEYVKSERLVF